MVSLRRYLAAAVLLIACVLNARHLGANLFNNLGTTNFFRQTLLIASHREGDRSVSASLHSAEECLRYAGRLLPLSERWRLNLARVFVAAGDPAAAINALEHVLGKAPDSYQARFLLGRIHADMGDWRQAAEVWTPIGAVKHLHRLSLEYAKQGETDIALALLEAAVEANPGFPEIWSELGWSRYEVSLDKEGAVAALQQAIALQPDDVDPYCSLCRVYYESRDDQRLFPLARQINAQFPDEDCGWGYMAYMLRSLGRVEEAERTLLEAIAQLPADPLLHDRLADLYYSQGRVAEAVQEWKTAVQLGPDKWWFHKHLGAALIRSGDRAGALESYRLALTLQPGNVELQEMVSKLERQLGQ